MKRKIFALSAILIGCSTAMNAQQPWRLTNRMAIPLSKIKKAEMVSTKNSQSQFQVQERASNIHVDVEVNSLPTFILVRSEHKYHLLR